MNKQIKPHVRSLAGLTAVLSLLTVGVQYQSEKQVHLAAHGTSLLHARVASSASFAAYERRYYPDTPTYRVASRLQRRLRRSGLRTAPAMSRLASAVEKRQALLSRSVTVHIATDDNPEHAVWQVSAQRYPLWLRSNFSATEADFFVSSEAVQRTLDAEPIIQVDSPIHPTLHAVAPSSEDAALRGHITGVGKPGYVVDYAAVAETVASALQGTVDQVTVSLEKTSPRIINDTGKELGELTLWATGRSNYRGSSYARSANVQKALIEHVNNTVVPPGATFSFNSTLNGPVSTGNGWHLAKVIFNGADLEYAPGGGICQASTTVYRATVHAGFPIVERRAHSLYVSYYKEHGVGMDATIYPGSQDLVFQNDSAHHLIIQAYHEGSEAFVHIYGTPDGRVVELTGPYFAGTAPDDFRYNGRKIAHNEIVWQQRVTYRDGTTRDHQIASRYKTLPQSLARQYTPGTVHAAAGLSARIQ